MIPADEESLEDLELLEIAESGSKRPSDGDTPKSKVQKIGWVNYYGVYYWLN